LIILAALPALNHLLSSDKRKYRLIPLVLFSLGFIIQLSAVLISDITHLIQLYQKYGMVYPKPILWGLGTIPVVGHLKMILEGVSWDLIFWRSYELKQMAVITSVIILVGIGMMGIFGLRGTFRGRMFEISHSVSIVLSCLAILLLGSILIEIARDDSQYYAGREDFARTNDWISQNAKPGDAILVDAYLDPVWFYLWNFGEAEIPIYSMPNRDSQSRSQLISLTNESSTESFYQLIRQQQVRVWLVCEKRCLQQVVHLVRRTMSANPQEVLIFNDPRPGFQTDLRLFELKSGS
jgi:hypothetical protein